MVVTSDKYNKMWNSFHQDKCTQFFKLSANRRATMSTEYNYIKRKNDATI